METCLNRFTTSKEFRDSNSIEKDKITKSFINKIKINHEFHALLMPSLYGHEAYTLIDNGAKPKQLFAIEREKNIHAELKECKLQDRKELRGICTTPYPTDTHLGIELAYLSFCKQYDFIYLDYLGKPNLTEHYKTLYKMFKYKMYKPNSLIILTFGTRCIEDVQKLNNQLKHIDGNIVATQEIVQKVLGDIALKLNATMKSFQYVSKSGNNKYTKYLTTVIGIGAYRKLLKSIDFL